jgi:hypothetical protein
MDCLYRLGISFLYLFFASGSLMGHKQIESNIIQSKHTHIIRRIFMKYSNNIRITIPDLEVSREIV